MSAVANVNVIGVFALVAGMVEKWKTKLRFYAFSDALKAQRKKEQGIRYI